MDVVSIKNVIKNIGQKQLTKCIKKTGDHNSGISFVERERENEMSSVVKS